jgi:hypothetical protein
MLLQQQVEYDPEKLHFVVCGTSGSSRLSSLINVFHGLGLRGVGAAAVGITETTSKITRYPDPAVRFRFPQGAREVDTPPPLEVEPGGIYGCGFSSPPVFTLVGEKLVREQRAGSGERGIGISSPNFWNFDDHGKADLLPWIINVWTFIKYWR